MVGKDGKDCYLTGGFSKWHCVVSNEYINLGELMWFWTYDLHIY
jgi:hypothetical protein